MLMYRLDTRGQAQPCGRGALAITSVRLRPRPDPVEHRSCLDDVADREPGTQEKLTSR
jgi:hypothetical protein